MDGIFFPNFPELSELNLPTPEELGTFVFYSLDVLILFPILAIVTLALISFLVWKTIDRLFTTNNSRKNNKRAKAKEETIKIN